MMQISALNSFYLVGGTCLSLRYGHRTSVDLDFFSIADFENKKLNDILAEAGLQFSYNNIQNPIGLFGFIGNVKIDKPVIEDGIRMFGDKDIIAMKIFAILQRAQKKDFWDLAELFKHYSFEECINAYYEKYPGN
ncbi:MAG: nucleotidyl transferase AbiEii/AbiGii toxin family protein [Ferruginibacter sp.]